MAKKAKKGKGKARVAPKREEPRQMVETKRAEGNRAAKPTAQAPDLAALRKRVLAAKGWLEAAEAEAKQVAEKARTAMAQAKQAYREALGPYREACRKAGTECEFEGGRAGNVSAKVSFIVEKVDKGIRVAVKGKPGSEELIPLAVLKASVGKAAIAYSDKYLGPRDRWGIRRARSQTG